MELRLDGKVALVTGASKGIGLAIATRFAAAGARVLLTSRKQEQLEQAAAAIVAAHPGSEVDAYAANAGEPDQADAAVQHCVRRFDGLDVLVNNAAANPYYGPLMGIDHGAAEKTSRVNELGYLTWTQLAWRATMQERGGCVLNLSSIGAFSVEPALGWYNVTKAAEVHLTRHLAKELSPGVRVNAIAPGIIRTDFSRQLWEDNEDLLASHIPMGRVGEPDDIARMALFLCSDAAEWITGQCMVVDGGQQVSGGL